MADAGGDGVGLVGLVIEDHERRCALGGEGVVILAEDLVFHVHPGAADPGDPDADVHGVGIRDLAAVIVGHRCQDRADTLVLVHVHQADLPHIIVPPVKQGP